MGDEHVEQPAAPKFELARHPDLGLGVAVGRRGGDLVEVDQDRLPDVAHALPGQVEPLGLLGQPSPRHPGADPQRGLERVEGAPLRGLPAADGAEDLQQPGPARPPVTDPVHESGECLLDGVPDDTGVGAALPGVLRHAGPDLADHLLGQDVQIGAEGLGELPGDVRLRLFDDTGKAHGGSSWPRTLLRCQETVF
ncbi:hypothetical protein ABZ260_13070 [Streptosporangium sp. NPDC006013]|uniref:hypothetical protein n=1 Tax=Streptosporangium sp. NPDC006013 TaxID=3155596 RepID=UPI0033A06B3A